MTSSPPTPTRRRKSSSIRVQLSFSSARAQSNGHSSRRPSNNQSSSQYSLPSPSTPRPISSQERSGYFESSSGLYDLIDPGNASGLGNLADELAGAFEEEDENEHGFRDGASEGLYGRVEASRLDQSKENEHSAFKNAIQNGHPISIPSAQQATSDLSLSPPKPSLRPGHTGENSQYDGSDYGDDSDLETTHSLVLEARLAAIEGLVRRGTEANGSDADGIVQRVANSLKDLGSQAGVENSATR